MHADVAPSGTLEDVLYSGYAPHCSAEGTIMTDSLHTKVENQPEQARSGRISAPAGPGLDSRYRCIGAASRGARPDLRGLSPGALLALQRTAGNRAVGALLHSAQAAGAQPRRGPRQEPRHALQQAGLLVQRMSVKEAKDILKNGLDMYGIADMGWQPTDDVLKDVAKTGWQPTDGVLKAIADEVTAYELSSRHGVDARQKAMERALGAFVDTTLMNLVLQQPLAEAEVKKFFTDAAHWTAQVRALIDQNRQGRAAHTAAAVRAIQANKEKQGVIPLGERVLVACTMGQGVAADLARFVLHSEDFSSCTAIVLFNADTGMGGLFHFAAGFAGKKDKTPQSDELRTLFNRVAPTQIHIDFRSQMPRDFADLSAFFVKGCGFSGRIVQQKEAGSCHAYLGDQGQLRITPSIEGAHTRLNLTSTDRLPDEVAQTGAVTMVHHEESYSNLFSK